jgi:Chemoreceptor zinc-binding domain
MVLHRLLIVSEPNSYGGDSVGIFSDMKGALTAGSERTASTAASKTSFDIVSAIEAHVRWKIRLEAHINGTSTENLDPETVCKDDQCVLGKWIHGEGRIKYGNVPLFVNLEKVHADFHQAAADVIRKANGGDKPAALAMLNEGHYAKCSYGVKTALARLCRAPDDH